MIESYKGRYAVLWMWLLLVGPLKVVNASHFRGAIIMLQPTNSGIEKEMEVSYHISWRRTDIYGGYCDDDLVNSGDLIGDGGIYCESGCSGLITSMQYQCTDFSITDDWSFGEGHYIHQFDESDDQIQIGFSGVNWISPFNTHWKVPTIMSLSRRNDTGKINSTPRASTVPVVRLQEGCNHTLIIAVSDPDGDQVRCRWAVGDNECGSACNAFPGSVLYTDSCTLSYEAVHGTGYKIIAVMIEDFLPGSDIPLSSVALQYLVYIYPSNELCSAKPEFVPPTVKSGSCLAVPPNTTYTDSLIAYIDTLGVKVTEIQTVSPAGFYKSPVFSSADPSLFYINITWNPEEEQLNQTHSFCYTAVNSVGVSSQQNCIQYMAGAYPPSIIHKNLVPITNKPVHPAEIQIEIMFDEPIKRPSLEAKILFRDYETNDILYSISTLISNEIFFSSETTFKVTPNFLFPEKRKIFVELERGIVVGLDGCNPGNEPVTGKDFLIFITKDTTSTEAVLTNPPSTTTDIITANSETSETDTDLTDTTSPEANSKVKQDHNCLFLKLSNIVKIYMKP